MSGRKKHWVWKVLGGILVIAITTVGVFFLVQWITKTGVFRVPGVITYSDSLSSEERAELDKVFTKEVDLDKDLMVSVFMLPEKPELKENEFLLEVYVPVTDFYSTETNIELEQPLEVMDLFDTDKQAAQNFTMISVNELDFTKKLLAINGKYYLDEFDSGAVFRVMRFESEKYTEEVAPVVAKLDFKERTFPTREEVLTLAQTGVTALSRGMNARLRAVGGDATYFAAEIGEYLSGFDLTHTSNESSFTSYATDKNICSDPRFIDTLTAIGLDIVELTGNHNQDCGDDAALETIDVYTEKGILMVGGGKTADAAAMPLEIDKKGNNVTMLAYNLSTGGATYDNTPGANQYYEEVAAQQIKEAKARGDEVIVDVQYYECSAYASTYEDPTCDRADSAAGDQVGFFRHLIDLGADVVVGTSAHQAQTYELYGDGVIYYGLGNLFFDQVWWPGTTRSLVLAHYFWQDKLVQTKLVGTVYGDDMQTRLMDAETLKWWLERLLKVRP